MRRLAIALALLGFGLAPASARADGTLFVFAFPQQFAGQQLSLRIVARTAADVTIEVPGLSFSQNVALAAMGRVTVALPSTAQAGGSGTTTSRAIRVTATAPIAVVALSRQPFSAGSFSVYPVPVLGTSYRAFSMPANVPVGAPSQVVIVGTQAGTTVQITPSANDSLPADVTTNVTLGALEVYALHASASGGDLTGTSIVSDKPVAVISGHQLANIVVDGGDPLLEMLPSLDRLGNVVPIVTTPDRFVHRARVLALEAVTLSYDPPVQFAPSSLGAGGVAEFEYLNDSVIYASGPILVGQVSPGGGGGLGDPSLLIANVWSMNPLVVVPVVNFPAPALTVSARIVAYCVDVGSSNGVGGISPAAFDQIGSSAFCVTVVGPLIDNAYIYEADHALSVRVFGQALGEAFAHGVELGDDTAPGDDDVDGIPNVTDNCPLLPNPGQQDGDADAVGDACDNCAATTNLSQSDVNSDGAGDRCQNGDFNGDGLNDIVDVVLQRRKLAGSEPTLDPAMPPQQP